MLRIMKAPVKAKGQIREPSQITAQFIYDGIFSHCKKSPIDEMGKNIWGKLMVFLTIRSIYPNGTNYNKLLLNYGENLCEKLMGKIYGEN